MMRPLLLMTLLLPGLAAAQDEEPDLVGTDGGFDFYGAQVFEPRLQPTPSACLKQYGKAAQVDAAQFADGGLFWMCGVESANGASQGAALEKALAALEKKPRSQQAIDATLDRFQKATVCPPGMAGTYDGHLACSRDYSDRQLCPEGKPGRDGTCLVAGRCPPGQQNLAELTKGAKQGCFKCAIGTFFETIERPMDTFVLCRERSDSPAAVARAKRRLERCEEDLHAFLAYRLQVCATQSRDSQCVPANIMRDCLQGYRGPAQGCASSCSKVLNQLTDERRPGPASR